MNTEQTELIYFIVMITDKEYNIYEQVSEMLSQDAAYDYCEKANAAHDNISFEIRRYFN